MARLSKEQRAVINTFNEILDSMPVDIGVNDFKKKYCGKLIDKGTFRDVYAFKEMPDDFVVKIERNMRKGNFANVSEWRNFINSRYSNIEQYLCPCELINETGQILVMRRATPITKDQRKLLPKVLPACITDLAPRNFGWYDGRIVAVDYSYFIPDQNERKVTWRK